MKNKTTRVIESINPISSNILPKNKIINNILENNKNNLKNFQNEKNFNENKLIDEKQIFIMSRPKIKSKTPGKIISSKNKIGDKTRDLYRKNIEIMNENNNNLENICWNIYNPLKKKKSSKTSINEKYKIIESKYKNDKKELTKEDTLFNEEDINNLNVKKEIITPFIHLEDEIDSIQICNNKSPEIIKSKKEGRNKIGGVINKKNEIEQSSIMSHDKEYPIIESYCMLMEKDNQNKSNFITNENNGTKNLTTDNEKDKNNESKIEAKQVQDLKDRVNQILNEF